MFNKTKKSSKTTARGLLILPILISFLLPQIVSAATPSLKLSQKGWFPNVTVGKSYFVDVTVLDASGKAPNPGVMINFEAVDSSDKPISTVTVNKGGACQTDSAGTCGLDFTVSPSHSGNFYIKATEGYPPPPSIYPSDRLGPITVSTSMTLTTTTPTVQKGTPANVVANLPNTTSGVTITFSVQPSSGTLSPISCPTSTSGNCNTSFSASSTGTYIITANATGYTPAPPLNITVTDTPAGGGFTSQPLPPITQGNTNTYQPLAPLPDPNNSMTLNNSVDVSGGAGGLNNYLNMMIKLIIGIAAVLAVVMIVVGGIERMSESVYHKSEGSKKIWEAILGLLLALASWAILNTINSQLLVGQVGVPQVVVSFDDEVETTPPPASSFSSSAPAGALNLCAQGVVTVQTQGGKFVVCSSISQNLVAMVNSANAQGIKLGGWGFRSHTQQIVLRTSHCGTGQYNVYQKPSSQCSPPTARPGSSRHESGVAVDFTCNGVSIQHQTNQTNQCFVWLKQNAGAYGLYNLPSEPWHWSIDGK